MRLYLKTLAVMVIPLACLCLAADSQGFGDLTIHISGMKNTSGYLNIAVADSEPGFLEKDKSYTQIRTRINGPEVSVVLMGMPHREYAVSVFHDENTNNTLDRNMMGIPKEFYGFSNNARGKFGPPSYTMSKFSFQSAAQTIWITVQ